MLLWLIGTLTNILTLTKFKRLIPYIGELQLKNQVLCIICGKTSSGS